MSLINQALRKTQRDRSPNRMHEPGEQTPASMAASSTQGMSPGLVIGLVIAVAVLIGLVAGLSIVLLKGDTTKPTAPITPVAPQVATTTSTQETPAPQTPAPIKQVIPEIETPAPAVAQTSAPSVVDELRKAREAVESQAKAEELAAQKRAKAEELAAQEKAKIEAAAAARKAAGPSDDILKWLGKAKVSGVKISDSGNKVILNGKTFAIGEYVNFSLGLKVLLIQQERVYFVDNNDKKYMKSL